MLAPFIFRGALNTARHEMLDAYGNSRHDDKASLINIDPALPWSTRLKSVSTAI